MLRAFTEVATAAVSRQEWVPEERLEVVAELRFWIKSL